jgi:methionyl-tRNA formyltransferase
MEQTVWERRMRIVLMGQAAFGEKVLEALLGSGEEVVAVYAPPDVSPGKSSTLVALAEAQGIPTRQPHRMRALDVIEDYRRFKAELNVMAFVTDIVPAAILSYPRHGSIQYHPSLLPRHRGASAINWAVMNGEAKTGLSIFWPDEGLDTGPILLQKEVAIAPDETMGEIYFNKLFPLGVESMLEAVALVKKGTAQKLAQDLTQGEYEPVCRSMKIDWSYPVGVVYNIIRGCNPSPGAATVYKAQTLRIFDCSRHPASGRQTPGTVTQITGDGFLVAGCGGSLLVKRVQTEGSPKMGAEEFISVHGLRVGDRLG